MQLRRRHLSVAPSGSASTYHQTAAIAVPVKDEEERLPACFGALAQQVNQFGRRMAPRSICVVAFVNNCTDNSAALARSLAEQFSLNVRVVEASLPPKEAHAGNARGCAMDLAEAWLLERSAVHGVILTTDADSRVPKDWIANNLAAIEAGADAVLGRVALDEDGALLPEMVHRRGALEDAYEALLTELSAMLDPIDCDPWPHHRTISGASLAVTAQAYRRVGGLPRVPLGEDKALVAELLRADARIRFAPEIQIVTSGRTIGRAPGGVADTLRVRSTDPEALCDEALEPCRAATKRAVWRGRLRRLRQSGRLTESGKWRSILRISSNDAQRVVRAPSFGAAWSLVEEISPCLRRDLLTPSDLPSQIAAARHRIARLRNASLLARQNVEPKRVVSGTANDPDILTNEPDEEFGGLISA
jgi:cellulose synthase/poly-beta-1,6-N-acetylglucosamine synthase-like glycosyltransferase